jgi:hypothetical protein
VLEKKINLIDLKYRESEFPIEKEECDRLLNSWKFGRYFWNFASKLIAFTKQRLFYELILIVFLLLLILGALGFLYSRKKKKSD